MLLKYRIRRLSVRLKKKFKKIKVLNNYEKLSEIQQKTITIIRKLIAKEDSILLISPISRVYHIEYEHLLIRFNESDCHIMNTKYAYYVYIPSREMNELIRAFNHKLEKKTNKVVSVYEKKTIQSLQDIINTLSPNT
jgi:hypothetical protein